MTERFMVPKQYLGHDTGCIDPGDLPAILRAEVAAALAWSNREAGVTEEAVLMPIDREYLAARYGAAPETVKVTGMDAQGHATMEGGTGGIAAVMELERTVAGAPTFTREAEALLMGLADEVIAANISEVLPNTNRAARAYLASREGR